MGAVVKNIVCVGVYIYIYDIWYIWSSIPSRIGNPCNGYINPYKRIGDHSRYKIQVFTVAHTNTEETLHVKSNGVVGTFFSKVLYARMYTQSGVS